MLEWELLEEDDLNLKESRDDKKVILGSEVLDALAILTLFGGVGIGLFFLFQIEDNYYANTFLERRPLFVSGVIVIVSSILYAILLRASAAYLRTRITFQNSQLEAMKKIQRILLSKQSNKPS